ncbi:MAG: hypothetical protein K8U57_18510 [Planctomycetes bacterium]|nr:hypothetical protein [Planctomycetota bacterium]
MIERPMTDADMIVAGEIMTAWGDLVVRAGSESLAAGRAVIPQGVTSDQMRNLCLWFDLPHAEQISVVLDIVANGDDGTYPPV